MRRRIRQLHRSCSEDHFRARADNDSRGSARSLTGDFQGAIADFQAFVKRTNDEEKKARRQEWIELLKAGKNPFTDEVLNEFKNQ